MRAAASAARGRRPLGIRIAEWLLLVLGSLALGYCVESYWGARVFQQYESWRLDRIIHHQPATLGALVQEEGGQIYACARWELDGEPADQPEVDRPGPLLRRRPALTRVEPRPAVAIRPFLPEGSLVGRVEIARIGLSAVVLEGDDEAVLSKALGHVPSTAYPGAPGNVAIAGHRDTFFRALKKIQKGDHITMVTPDGTYEYRVAAMERVNPSDVQVLDSAGYNALTLITCYPFEYIGSAPKRFIVHAVETHSTPAGDMMAPLPAPPPDLPEGSEYTAAATENPPSQADHAASRERLKQTPEHRAVPRSGGSAAGFAPTVACSPAPGGPVSASLRNQVEMRDGGLPDSESQLSTTSKPRRAFSTLRAWVRSIPHRLAGN